MGNKVRRLTVEEAERLAGMANCPSCGKRVHNLYRPTSDDPWKCRVCHNLGYLSDSQRKREKASLAHLSTEELGVRLGNTTSIEETLLILETVTDREISRLGTQSRKRQPYFSPPGEEVNKTRPYGRRRNAKS